MTESRPACVVHLASRVTEEVFGFLGPATASLSQMDVRQIVIVLDDPRTHTVLRHFDPEVSVRRVPSSGWPWVDLGRLHAELLKVLAEGEPQALHLHGVLPCLVGAVALRRGHRAAAVYFTPHASRLLGRFRRAGRVLVAAAELLMSRQGARAIAAGASEARDLERISDFPVDVIECPVATRFLQSARQEAASACIVAGSRVSRADPVLDAFIQLSVLLGDSRGPVRFAWVGPVDDAQRARLKAARIDCTPLDDEVQRAAVLSQAWIYLAPAGGQGVPVGMAEAMASGVPCVAAATAFHRDLVTDGETGFLYAELDQALKAVVELLESPALRGRVGAAARDEAQRRFHDLAFRERLVRSYRDANLLDRASFVDSLGSIHPLSGVAAATPAAGVGEVRTGATRPLHGGARSR